MSTPGAPVLLKKRERTQNWIPEEKNALFALIKTHANAIENKKIDAAASAMKNLAWQQIYAAFRGKFSTDRDITRMREQWRRMKAQARMEMHAFIEKIKNVGPDDAVKNRPSKLAIEVWRLLEKAKKNDADEDRSDEDSQDCSENAVNVQAILDKLTPTELTATNIKVEVDSDDYNSEEENRVEVCQRNPRKRLRMEDDEPMDLAEQSGRNREISVRQFDNEEDHALPSSKDKDDRAQQQDESICRAMWMFEAAQKKHELKLRILKMELERAELQKQAAINELTASEIKKQMIESQAAEYQRLHYV